MSGWWVLLLIPVTLATQASILGLSVFAEQRLLSPRSIIRVAVRRATPEHAEVLIAQESERLLSS